MQDGNVSYALADDGLWVLRLQGDLRFTLSPAINKLLDRLFADERTQHLLLDMRGAENIDSTNLGVLVRVARFAKERGDAPPVILSSNPNITQLLQGICFDQLFTILPSADYQADSLAKLTPLPADEREMLSLVLEAHRNLSAIDERNHAEFAPLIAALEQQ